MNKNPKISIVVPVYNTGKYLKKCLDSLRFQTYDNLEILCIDDGSEDDSLEILKSYEKTDSRFKVFAQDHQGTSCSRNFGIEKSSGDYISFIDSDDWVLLTLYQTFVDYIAQVSEVIDIYMFNVAAYIKGYNDVVPKVFFDLADWNNHNDKYTVHVFNDCMRPFSRNLSAANKIYRKDFLVVNDIKFPEGLKYEDQYFSIKAFLRAKSIMINDDIFYRYRNMNETSSTLSVTPKVFDIFKIVDLIEAELDSLNLYESYKYALFQFKYNVYSSHYKYCPLELKQGYYNEMKMRLLSAEKRNLDCRIYPKLRNYNIFEKIKKSNFVEYNSWIEGSTN